MADLNITSKNTEYGAATTVVRTTKSIELPPYEVSRNVLLQDNVNDLSEYERGGQKFSAQVRQTVCQFNVLAFILNVVPLLKWLPTYSIRKDLIGDVMAGITVAVMHIPQGMAYGLLAGVTPNTGLYMAFFPTLVYFVFGTSRHISVGTLSVISVMTLQVVQKYSQPSMVGEQEVAALYTANEVVTATAFMCGLQMILLSFLQLGKIATLLSESLVNGFTTGAAVHVLVSQLKDLLGIKVQRYKGLFQAIYTVTDVCKQLRNTNLYTLLVSSIIIVFMVIMNELIKPRVAKCCPFPVPAELIAVGGGTLASYLLGLSAHYQIHAVGHIPLGLPVPEMPPVPLIWAVFLDALPITIVSYSVTISMAMILAKKQKYEVRPNQELFAMGCSNIVGGLFSCLPNATSLSRSLIQEQTGGRTQFASVISSLLILTILLWIGPVFEVLPRCVLAGIIVVALKGMYMQATALKRFHRESKLNSLTWIVTFLAVVLMDVDIGLVAGLCISLLAIYLKGWRSTSCELGNVPGTDLYVDLDTHHRALAVPGVRIYRYVGSVNFAFSTSFKRALYAKTKISSLTQNAAAAEAVSTKSLQSEAQTMMIDEQQKLLRTTQALIIDLSYVTHIDVEATKTLQEIQKEMEELNVRMYLAAPNDRVLNTIVHAEWLGVGKFVVLPSIHDAVLYATAP